jgi:chromosome segregation ATPase
MMHQTMLRFALFIIPWFVAGGLSFFSVMLHNENAALGSEVAAQRDYRQQYEQQLAINTEQRERFETRIQQLQDNLRSSQVQMTNLSEALQEAREMMEPATGRVNVQLDTEVE